MKNYIKINVNKVKNAPIMSIAGAVAAGYMAKKHLKFGTVPIIAAAIGGAIIAANISFIVNARIGQPTAKDVK